MNRKYTFSFEHNNTTNKLNISSENDGFNALELLGLITWKQSDIIKQLNNEINPDIVKRKVVED